MESADERESKHLTPQARYLCEYVRAWAPYGLQDALQIFVEFGIRREELIERAHQLVRVYHLRVRLIRADAELIRQLHNALHEMPTGSPGVASRSDSTFQQLKN